MSKSAKIVVENLSKSFGSKHVLDNISFEVKTGESYVVMGGSGTGKSVLIKSIMGLHLPDEGSKVLFDGVDITYMPILKRDVLTAKIGVLFQGGALFDSLTVAENICFAKHHEVKLSKKDSEALALEKLKMVGLGEDVLGLFPSELSGGMIKRVALARAIANDPEVIFFDEPTAGLDPIMSGVISDLIHHSSKQLGATTITITHDMNCAKRVADKCALLKDGKFVWTGSGDEMDKSGNVDMDNFFHGRPS